MATRAYYDRQLDERALRVQLATLSAKPVRRVASGIIYGISGGGEAMVESSGGAYRLRLFAGKCSC